MEPYTDIAPVYDSLLRHVDYQEWYEYILSVMKKHAEQPGLILELGCGTGRFGSKFSNDGYTIYGIDKSPDMLLVAKTRAFLNFRIFCADITRFHVAKKMDFIFSVHDTMNYLLDNTDIHNMLHCVRAAMHERSIFMFDITTEHNILKNFDGKTSNYSFKNSSVRWSNRYDAQRKLVYSTLRFNRAGGTTTEEHVQRIYPVDEMRRLVTESGLDVLGIYGDYSFDPPGDNTIMINFVTRKA
jgi:SAM-dependent methyltransferase